MRIQFRRFVRIITAGTAFLLGATLNSAVPSQASIPTLFGEVHGQETAANSGVNITAFTLHYFHKPVVLPKLATSLGAGPTWAHTINMFRIKRVLEISGLRVTVCKSFTYAKIAKWLAKNSHLELTIVYLKNNHIVGQGPVHYLALLGRAPEKLYVADLGAYLGWLSLRYLNNHFGPELGNMCLFVRAGGAGEPKHAYTLTKQQRIMLNIGEVAAGPGMLKIPFLMRNTLKKPIGINLARGTCYCFRGAMIATANNEIAPDKTGKIVMTFDRSVIGIGNIEREVLLSFTGYPHHLLEIIVKCHITATHPPIQLTWYPQAIDLVVVRNRKALGGEEFTILTPKGISLQTPLVSSKFIHVIQLRDSGDKPQVDYFGRTAHEFVVDLSHMPAGSVNEKITIATTDKYVPSIVIPITGEIRK